MDEVIEFGNNIITYRNCLSTEHINRMRNYLYNNLENSDDYELLVKEYSTNIRCDSKWYGKTIAYRCFTCAYSPTVVYCNGCFDKNAHTGHNYKQYRTTMGICDCGDVNALVPSGFCHDHAIKENVPEPPENFLEISKAILPFALIKILRCTWQSDQVDKSAKLTRTVIRIASMGSYMRDHIARLLLDEDLYQEYFSNDIDRLDEEVSEKKMAFVTLCEKYGSKNLSEKMVPFMAKKCMLDSFYHALNTNQNSDEFIGLLVTFAAIDEYQVVFAKNYAVHYPLLLLRTLETPDSSSLYEAISLGGQQIVSTPVGTAALVTQYSFMEITLSSLFYQILEHHYAELTDEIEQNWVPTHDFTHILYHKVGSEYFFSNYSCIEMWSRIVTQLQGLFVNTRERVVYVEMERKDSIRIFTIELQRCILPLWTMLLHMQSEEVFNTIYKFFLDILMDITAAYEDEPEKMTFNLPVHRVVSVLLAHGLKNNFLHEKEISLEEEIVKNMLRQPLRTKNAHSEMQIGYWVRNGAFVSEQAQLYKYPKFSSSAFDPDHFIVQFLYSHVDPSYVVESVLDRFYVVDLMDKEGWYDDLKKCLMMEEALFFFASLLSSRVLTDPNGEDEMKEEFITMLLIKERSHSEIMNLIPEKGLLMNEKWSSAADDILEEIADLLPSAFSENHDLTQGKYRLKDEILIGMYDPVLVRMKCTSFRDYIESLEKYFSCAQKKGVKAQKEDLWPPFRAPNKLIHPYFERLHDFVHSTLMHAFLYVLLHHIVEKGGLDNILHLTIHLLHMMILYPHNQENTQYSTSIYENCLVPFDEVHNVLSPRGLKLIFSFDRNESSLGSFFDLPSAIESQLATPEDTNTENPLESQESSSFETPPPPVEREKSTQTIVSLLLKIYKTIAKKTYEPSPFDERERGERIGGGSFFIGEVLDGLVAGSDEVRRVVDDMTGGEDPEAKRKAALERKKRLAKERIAKEMKKKQELSKKMLAEENFESDDEEDENIPNCCVCSEPAAPSMNNPPCFAALASRTSLLGRRILEEPAKNFKSVPGDYSYHFKIVQDEITRLNLDNAVDLWFDGILVQTCGHILHYNCYQNHMLMLKVKRKVPIGVSKFYQHEYWCPVCRQLCNTILLMPEEAALPTNVSALPPVYDTVRHLLEDRIISRIPENYEKAAVFYLKHAGYNFNHYILYVNLLRISIEMDLMHKNLLIKQDEKIDSKSAFYLKPSKKIHLGALYDFCKNLVRDLTSEKPLKNIAIFNPQCEESGDDRNVALIDLKNLLIKILLFIPECSAKEIRSVIIFFINLYVLQISTWTVLCSDVGRIGKWIEADNLAGSELGFIFESLVLHSKDSPHRRKKYSFEKMSKSIYTSFTDFLKFCALLYNSIIHPKDPTITDIANLKMDELLSMLVGENLENHISSIKCYQWDDETRKHYISKFCEHTTFLLYKKQNFKLMKTMLTSDWLEPSFVKLPSEYFHLYINYINVERSDWQDVILCLICGESIIVKSTRERREIETQTQPIYYLVKTVDPAMTKHSVKCGEGSCVYIGNDDNAICLNWRDRVLVWNSIYLDKYGEEDRKYKRGKELYLNNERLHFLRYLWLFNAFDVIFSDYSDYIY